MNLTEALRLIAGKSPNNIQNAMRALRGANRSDALSRRSTRYVLEQALIDPLADFTTEERNGILALLGDKKGEVLRVRVTADEKDRVQAMADAAGLTVSDFIRERIGL